MAAKAASTPQKQPAPNVAFSLVMVIRCASRSFGDRSRYGLARGSRGGAARYLVSFFTWFFLLEVRFEAREGLVPLLGHRGQVGLEALERLWIELEKALAAGVGTADDSGALEDAQVLGDGLAGKLRVVSELRDGGGLAGAKPGDECEAGFVAERGKYACPGLRFGGDALTDFV